MAHHQDDGDGNDPMAIGSSEEEEEQQQGAAAAAAPAPAAAPPAAARRRAPAAKKRAPAAASSDEEEDDDEAKKKKKPTPAKKPAARKPPAATAARRAEAERAMKEEEERRERERVAAGPRFEALANQHATQLIPLLVANGGGALSAVDLCELAVASKAFGDAVRAFWQSVQPPSAAAGALAAPNTTTTTAPNAATLLSSLSLEFSAWDAGRDRNERKNPGGTCAACGQFPAVASGYVAPGVGSKPVCKGCFGGMGTAFDESRGGTPRALLAHCAAVFSSTAAHLFGTTPEEVAAAVPRYRPRCAAFKKERGMRVSLRQAANWAMKQSPPGPLGLRRRRASMALSEAAELSADVPRGGGGYYESLDSRAMDFRRHALRKALALALKGRVYSPAAAGTEEQPSGKAPRGKKAAAPLGDRPFDFEKHGGAALQAAANSHIGAGTPSVAAIVAMAVKMAELVQPGAAGGGAAAAAAAEPAEEEEEAAAAPAPAAGKKKAAPPKRKAPAKAAAKAPAAKKKKAAEDDEESSEEEEATPAPPAAAAKKKKQQQPKKKKLADEEDEDESGGEDDDDEAPAAAAAAKKKQPPPQKKKPAAAAAAAKPARGRGK